MEIRTKHLIHKQLCTRCGACFAADYKKILSKSNQGYPIHDCKDEDYLNNLLKVCSGENWNYQNLLEKEYGTDVDYNPNSPDIGIHRSIYLVSSSDKIMRDKGQSGGITTTLLLHALERGLIDAVLAVRRPSSITGNPFASEPFLARSKDELLESCGSKYTICSTLEKIPELIEKSENFAITALPCQTVGFKRLVEDFNPQLKEQCKLIIGPYCGLNMETEAGEALASAVGVQSRDVFSFKNRGGIFPGQTTLQLKSGENRYIDRTAHRILYRMYSPLRCYTCTDYGNELADISVADCWLMEKGEYKYPEGAAYVICRSERGERLVEEAILKGVLISHSFDELEAKKNWEASFYHRKVRAHNRINYWQKRGKPVPCPDYPMPQLFKPSLRADRIEMGAWRLFRSKFWRHFVLKIWLWLAKSKKGTIRNLVFEDLKFYLFTHRFDQFQKANYKKSILGYLKAIKSKISRLFPKPIKAIIKFFIRLPLVLISFLRGWPIKKDPNLKTLDLQESSFKAWGYYSKKWAGKPRILMAAGHGYGNVGDEAQCGAAINRWRRVYPECKITLFSPNPAYTEALHNEQCEWAPRVAWFRSNTIGPYDGNSRRFIRHYKWLKFRLVISAHMVRRGIPLLLCNPREARILQVLQNHDLLHISGGGFLTGKTRSRLWENCLLMRICQILDVPYMLTGHNIGVFQDSADRKVTRLGLRKAKYIGLRDRGISEKELAEIGIKGDHVQSTCDDALLCPRLGSDLVKKYLENAGANPNKPWAAVNFHHWGQKKSDKPDIEKRFAEICDYIVEKYDLQIIFIAMTPTDVEPEENILKTMKNIAFLAPYNPDYKVVRGIIADSSICFTMKHHPIVFAQGEGVPVVCVALDDYYYHKNKGALENTGHGEYVLPHDEFFSQKSFMMVDISISQKDKIREEMLEWVNEMKELELKPYRNINF